MSLPLEMQRARRLLPTPTPWSSVASRSKTRRPRRANGWGRGRPRRPQRTVARSCMRTRYPSCSNEQLSSAPLTQTMSAEREELTMDPIYAFYTDSLYSCCFAGCSHGDTVVAHELLLESPASFDTPAGQFFQRKDDIKCIPGSTLPALKIIAFPLVAQILQQVYPLTATSSLACINFHIALSCLSIGSVAYLGGSHRKRMIEAHSLREPPCNLGCCTLSPPFNPYCCWFCWCPLFAAAQESKAMNQLLRRRAIDATYNRL